MHDLLQDTHIHEMAEVMNHIKTIYITAHGSSYNAAVSISDFIARSASVRCFAMTPCMFMDQQHSIWNEDVNTTLFVAITQTGTSRGVLEVTSLAKLHGFQTLAITAEENTAITQLCDYNLFLHCRSEKSNAKTKGYSCTLLLLILFGIHLGEARKTLQADPDLIYQELSTCIDEIPSLMTQAEAWCRTSGIARHMQNLYVIGYGMNYGSALEGQLKVMETMCIPTMYNDLLEFSHGMHRSIHYDSTILLIRTEHTLDTMMESTYQYLKTICRNVYMIDTVTKDSDTHRLSLPYHMYTESLLSITTTLQVISVYVPEAHGLDPNRPANDAYTDIVTTRVL